MALSVHLIRKWDPSAKRGETECGEPFHWHPQNVGKGLNIEGEYEAGRRIGGLRAHHEPKFGEIVSQRYGNGCKKCIKVWTEV